MPSLLTLLAAFSITLCALLPLRFFASKTGLMDYPGGRKDHCVPTPLIGGIGIYLGILLVTFLMTDFFEHYRLLLAISALVLLIGVMDDYRELSVSLRMGVQILASVLMFYLAGNQLNSVGNLVFTGSISLGIMSLPITAFATVGVINATNMADGIDGLCGGMVVIALSFLGWLNYQQGSIEQTGFIALLICTLLAYLTLNFRLLWKLPALIYLGDSGSVFLGFVLAWLLIESTQGSSAIMPPVLALWFLAMPLMDTVMLLIKRPLEGKSPFQPGRDHLHHRLLRRGFSQTQVILMLWGTGIVVGLTGLFAYNHGISESALFVAFMSMFGFYVALIKYSAYFRISE